MYNRKHICYQHRYEIDVIYIMSIKVANEREKLLDKESYIYIYMCVCVCFSDYFNKRNA